MRHRALLLLTAILGSLGALASASPSPATAAPAALPRLTLAEEATLAELIEAHRRVAARLPAADRDLLVGLVVLVKPRLFATRLGADLLEKTTLVVNQIIPELTTVEAEILAEYALGGITSDTSIAPTIESQQQACNQQMIKLQMAMQRENTLFTSVSNVLKTRHDTVKNSIGNIR